MLKHTQVVLGFVLTTVVSAIDIVPVYASLTSYSRSENSNSVVVAQRRTPPPGLPGTTRGDVQICFISPGVSTEMVWSDRPLFLWTIEGEVNHTEVQRILLLDSTGEVLWEKSLTATAEYAVYDGDPLQPGQDYYWKLEWNHWDERKQEWAEAEENYSFLVMDTDRRSQIVIELQQLTDGVDTETAANRQSDYFAEQDLWSDALQTLFSVDNPSNATKQRLQELLDHICSSPARST